MLDIKWLDRAYSVEGYSDYENGLLRVRTAANCGIIDLEQNVVIPFVYHHIEHFRQGLALVRSNGCSSYVDRQNKMVISFEDYFVRGMSDNGLIMVGTLDVETRKWGFADLAGKIVIPLEYEDANHFADNLAAVQKDGLYGFINTEAKTVIPFTYNNVQSFKNGVAVVRTNEGYGVVSCSGGTVLEPKYDFLVTYWGGNIAVQQGSKWGVFNKLGEQLVPFIYDDFTTYNCDGYAEVGQNGKNGLIDKDGKLVVPLEYESVSFFKNGYAEASLGRRKKVLIRQADGKVLTGFNSLLFGFTEGLAAVKKKGKWGYVDETGAEVIPPQYVDVTGFSDGLARAMDKDGKCGFIDKQNHAVIPFVYDWVYTFNGKNHAAVKNGYNPIFNRYGKGKEGLVDRNGNVLLPVIYDEVITAEKDNIVFVKQDRQWGYAVMPEPL